VAAQVVAVAEADHALDGAGVERVVALPSQADEARLAHDAQQSARAAVHAHVGPVLDLHLADARHEHGRGAGDRLADPDGVGGLQPADHRRAGPEVEAPAVLDGDGPVGARPQVAAVVPRDRVADAAVLVLGDDHGLRRVAGRERQRDPARDGDVAVVGRAAGRAARVVVGVEVVQERRDEVVAAVGLGARVGDHRARRRAPRGHVVEDLEERLRPAVGVAGELPGLVDQPALDAERAALADAGLTDDAGVAAREGELEILQPGLPHADDEVVGGIAVERNVVRGREPGEEGGEGEDQERPVSHAQRSPCLTACSLA
jgi:hypothetical protein